MAVSSAPPEASPEAATPIATLCPAWRWAWRGLVVTVAVVGAVSLSSMPAGASNGYGLISVFPAPALACLVVLTLSFVWLLKVDPADRLLPVIHVVALILLLYGAAPLSEKVARWSVSWYTAGFVNQVAHHGVVLHGVDARWSWPGFFAGAASLLGPAGIRNADVLLLWTPVALALAYLPPMLSIADSLMPSRMMRWLAVWIFFCTDWTAQQYFSPQGLAFLLFLAALAIALRYFGYRGSPLSVAPERRRCSGPLRDAVARSWQRVRRWAEQEDAVAAAVTPRERAGMLAILIVIFAALTVSHQFTPVALILDLVVLALAGRLSARTLPVLFFVMMAGYISWFATDYWAGHLAQLFGVTAGVGSSLSQNVGQHITGNTAHLLVVYERLVFTGAVWFLAGLGVLRRLRRSRLDVTAVGCFAAPLLLPVVQPYGGEAIIRTFLYGLPFASILAAVALWPGNRRRARWLSWSILGLLLVATIPGFLVATYGNEQFEAMRPGEVAAAQWFYRTAPAGSTLLSPDGNNPAGYQGLSTYHFVVLAPPFSAAKVVAALQAQPAPASYVLLTTSEAANGTINDNLPPGWEQRLQGALLQQGTFQTVFSRPNAVVLRYQHR